MDVSLQVFYPELPVQAELAPSRAVYVGAVAGRCEVYAWDGTGARQVTDRPQGTVRCALDPTGEHVLWFDDDLAGVGEWRTQPFAGGPDAPALPGVPAGRAAGLATALDGTIAAAVATDVGTTVHLTRDGRSSLLLRTDGYRHLVDLAPDAGLVAVGGEPHATGAVTVLTASGAEVAALDGGAGQVWGMGFAPAGPTRLLLVAEVAGGYAPALWTPEGGLRVLDGSWFDSEIAASWYADGHRILVRHDREARSRLVELDLRSGRRQVLPTPVGTILAAGAQPDGDLHYVWTSGTHPPRLCTTSGLRLPGPVPGRVPGRGADLWAAGPGGRVHALVNTPDGPGPHPTVFLLHGGPHQAARDAYDPLVTIFASAGIAVVRPNYRGSTGYGARWRDGFADGVGLPQLADLAAVRRAAVEAGIAVPGRTAVCGESWGGYLALLAAGVQPELWRAVAAVSPVADYVGAYRTATPAVRALDRRLFGGDPDEVPDRYAEASPLTYAGSVRAPLLVVAGSEDPLCPPGQIRAYAAALAAHGRPPQLHWLHAGHEGYDAASRAETLGRVVRFVGEALVRGPGPDRTATRDGEDGRLGRLRPPTAGRR